MYMDMYIERMYLMDGYVVDKELYLASCRVFDKMYKDRRDRLREANYHNEMSLNYYWDGVSNYFEDECVGGMDENGHTLRQAVWQEKRNTVYGFASRQVGKVDLPNARDVKRVLSVLEDETAIVSYLQFMTVGRSNMFDGSFDRPTTEEILELLRREVDLPYLLSKYKFDKESYMRDLEVVTEYFESVLGTYGIEVLPERIEAFDDSDIEESLGDRAEQLGIFRIEL